MGKGDVKSRKGKLVKGSFGNSRLRKRDKKTAEKAPAPKTATTTAAK